MKLAASYILITAYDSTVEQKYLPNSLLIHSTPSEQATLQKNQANRFTAELGEAV